MTVAQRTRCTMRLPLLLSLATNVTLYDKFSNLPIENLTEWTPRYEACNRVPDENFNLVAGKFKFPRYNICIEIMDSSDAYLLQDGNLVHHNNLRELVLVENVTNMSLDRVRKTLYWVKDGILWSWGGFVARLPSDAVDFEVTNGNVVVMREDNSFTLNDEPISRLKSNRICFFPRQNVDAIYEYFIIPLAMIICLPCYLISRSPTVARKIRQLVTECLDGPVPKAATEPSTELSTRVRSSESPVSVRSSCTRGL